MKTVMHACALALFLSGCASMHQSNVFHGIKVEDGETPLELVEIENSGWELFTFIPIASGDPRYPNRNRCRWFTNTVTLQNNLGMLEKEMKAKGATRFTNLTSRISEETFLFIVLTRNAYHTSVVLLKESPAGEAPPEKAQQR